MACESCNNFPQSWCTLAKIDQFRDLLEEHAYSLSDRRGMCDLIPFIQSEEQQQIKAELHGKRVSVIFDVLPGWEKR